MITVGFNKVFVQTNIALGNHMFQYAICRITAMKNGYKFYIPYVGNLDKCFPGIDLGQSDGDIRYSYTDSNSQVFNPDVFKVRDFTNLNGYYQTEKYLEGYESDVKSWFKIEIDEKTKSYLEKYPIDKYCYMHIRGGDNKFGNNNWLIPKEYYLRSMEEINKKNNLSFVIITDDLELSNQYFPEIEAISDSVMVDFKLLYYSKYCIISASSFSWWSSWLSDKIITIAPNRWLNYNKPKEDFYPIDVRTDKFIWI